MPPILVGCSPGRAAERGPLAAPQSLDCGREYGTFRGCTISQGMGIDGLDRRCPRAGARGEWARNRWLRGHRARRQDWCRCSAVTDSRGRRPHPGGRPSRRGGVHPGFVRRRGVLVGDCRAAVRPDRGRGHRAGHLAAAAGPGRTPGPDPARAGRGGRRAGLVRLGDADPGLRRRPAGRALRAAGRSRRGHAGHRAAGRAAPPRPAPRGGGSGRHHAGPDPDRARGHRGGGAPVRRRGRGLRAGTPAHRRGADAGRGELVRAGAAAGGPAEASPRPSPTTCCAPARRSCSAPNRPATGR